MTRLYEWLDRRCVTSSDGRVELSDAAHDGRLRAYHLPSETNRAEVIPMGSWTGESPRCDVRCLEAPRLVFLGHLVERMGVPLVLDLAEALRDRGRSVPIDIVGGGPMLAQLQAMSTNRGLSEVITFHGFVSDFADVQQLLATAAIGLAPYETDETSFSRFADPGKLKAYLGAGLPVMLTPVPPNALEMASEGGAELLPPDPTAFADAVVAILDDRQEWIRRHEAATNYSLRFDWGRLFEAALPRLGVLLGPGAQPDQNLAQ
jgi:glycosyltransferase involved in cell wall biosynthesis